MADTAYTWTVGDDQKAERKRFRQRLDQLETIVGTQGSRSRCRSSSQPLDHGQGRGSSGSGLRHASPRRKRGGHGARPFLRRRCGNHPSDALTAVEAAELIAPTVKRPRKAYEMGEREVKLGSLREGEQLYRQAKKRASETVTWWAKAEEAILEATRALDGKDGAGANQLREVLSEAKAQLAREQPKEAYEIAIVILPQLDADADAIVRAEQSVEEAARSVAQSDGLDTSEMEARLEQASEALASGNASQAIGLADGVVRTLERSARWMMCCVR